MAGLVPELYPRLTEANTATSLPGRQYLYGSFSCVVGCDNEPQELASTQEGWACTSARLRRVGCTAPLDESLTMFMRVGTCRVITDWEVLCLMSGRKRVRRRSSGAIRWWTEWFEKSQVVEVTGR